ncbi:MAG: Rrf2 family transcriptional regulator [Spirochaetales bacterium]|nr:Rrf2 family transcriptional regulator [Spirochaetales bacterium]
MKVSAKVRYGFRFMINLALNYPNQLVQIKEVADKEQISPKYLEQIAASLKKADLVKVSRGAKGGYLLPHAPQEITLLDIYHALDGSIQLTDCNNNLCPNGDECIMNTLWKGLSSNIEAYFAQRTLASLICQK